jgi:hypothetical protein
MAIQPIKSAPRTAYVIKGTSKPQSYGQAWAQLMTQEKYRLWEQAQKDAIYQLNQAETDYQTKVKIYNDLKSDLQSRIQDSQSNIDKLKVKEAEAISAQSKWEATPAKAGTGTRISKSDSDATILDKVAKDRRIAKDSAWKEYSFYIKENQRIEKQAAIYDASPNPMEQRKAEELRSKKYTEADMRGAKNNYETANADYEQALQNTKASDEQKKELAAPYRERQSTVGGTAGQEKGKYEIPEYQSLMAENQSKIDKLQAELDALEAPTRGATPGLIEKTREVYQQSNLGQPTSLPISSIVQRFRKPSTPVSEVPEMVQEPMTKTRRPDPERIAELEALGADETTINEILAQDFGPQRPDLSPTYDGQKFGEAFPTESSLYPIGESGKTSDYIKPTPETPYDVRGTAPSRDLVEGNTTFEDVALERGVSPYTPNFPKEPSYADIAKEQGRKAYEADLVRQAQLEARQNRADMEFLGVPVGDLPEPQVQLPDAGPFAPGERYIDDLGLSAQDSLGAMSQELRGYQPPQTIQELQQKREFLKVPEAPKIPEQPKLPKRIMYKSEVFTKGTKMKKEEVNKLLYSDDRPEYAKVVEGLYSIPPNITKEKRDKLLQNAWDEITLTYSDDRETMKKAHIFLIALDNQMDQKPE